MDIREYWKSGMAAAERILRCRENSTDIAEREVLSACVWGLLRAWSREIGAGENAEAIMDRVLTERMGCTLSESAARRRLLMQCTEETEPFLAAVIRGGEALYDSRAGETVTAAFLRAVTSLARRELERT